MKFHINIKQKSKPKTKFDAILTKAALTYKTVLEQFLR